MKYFSSQIEVIHSSVIYAEKSGEDIHENRFTAITIEVATASFLWLAHRILRHFKHYDVVMVPLEKP